MQIVDGERRPALEPNGADGLATLVLLVLAHAFARSPERVVELIGAAKSLGSYHPFWYDHPVGVARMARER